MANRTECGDVRYRQDENKVRAEELRVELKAAILEFFVGTCEEAQEGLTLSLVNGQKFRICVEEA